jgi:hypothetical protein
MRRRPSRPLLFLCFAILLGLSTASSQTQDGSLSITRDADSLMAKLLQTPQDAQLQRKLIDEYVRTANPELALVEIAYAESFGMADNASVEL